MEDPTNPRSQGTNLELQKWVTEMESPPCSNLWTANIGEEILIMSLRDSNTRKFVESGKSKYRGMDTDKADMRFAQLEALSKLSDIEALNSIGLHKLHGVLKDFWSMDINGPWRLIFQFRDGNAYEVFIGDTH